MNLSLGKKYLAWDKGKTTKLKYYLKGIRLSVGWNLTYEICLRINKASSEFLAYLLHRSLKFPWGILK